MADDKPAPAAPASKAPAAMTATPWEAALVTDLRARFGSQILETSTYLGQNFIIAAPQAIVDLLRYLKVAAGFDYLVDITAVDWPKRADRFDLVYIVYSFSRNERVRLQAQIHEGYPPPTAVGVHATANWLEREVFDMFGIEFAGHPDLRRILLPDGWDGHPLRKDYPILRQDQAWVHDNLHIESGQ